MNEALIKQKKPGFINQALIYLVRSTRFFRNLILDYEILGRFFSFVFRLDIDVVNVEFIQ